MVYLTCSDGAELSNNLMCVNTHFPELIRLAPIFQLNPFAKMSNYFFRYIVYALLLRHLIDFRYALFYCFLLVSQFYSLYLSFVAAQSILGPILYNKTCVCMTV